jgi:hypothetical protein
MENRSNLRNFADDGVTATSGVGCNAEPVVVDGLRCVNDYIITLPDGNREMAGDPWPDRNEIGRDYCERVTVHGN